MKGFKQVGYQDYYDVVAASGDKTPSTRKVGSTTHVSFMNHEQGRTVATAITTVHGSHHPNECGMFNEFFIREDI